MRSLRVGLAVLGVGGALIGGTAAYAASNSSSASTTPSSTAKKSTATTPYRMPSTQSGSTRSNGSGNCPNM